MQDTTFRRGEIVYILTAVILYVVRRLIQEIMEFDDMIGIGATGDGIPAGRFWHFLDNYDHTLNNNVPLIGGAVLFLAAWYVFHALAYPKLRQDLNDQHGWLLVGATVLLLFISTFVYHDLKLHIRYQHNQEGRVIGLVVYSLYRKRTVLADAIGLGVVILAYEVVRTYYLLLANRITPELKPHFQLVSILLLSGVSVMVLNFALRANLPPTLWQSPLRDPLFVLGMGVQIAFFQEYVYKRVAPHLNAFQTNAGAPLAQFGQLLLLIAAANLLIGGAGSSFRYELFALRGILTMSVIVLVGAVFIAYARQVLTREKTVLQTQVSVASAELASLRAQINPHFLFNALNSLYATALTEKSDKTADGIQKLGDMMRFMLHENNHERIPLDKEIEYLHNYIQIQQMRLDQSHPIEIRVNIQEPNHPIHVAPMLLTPFVENAFKHGISLRQPSWIYITLTYNDAQLYFKVHNSRPTRTTEQPDRPTTETGQSGVGLANVQKRLSLIYPGRHELTIQQSESDYFVSLTLAYW
jgi:two-component system, LytTR family, sensor kinase